MKKIALFLVLAVLCASEVDAQKKPRRRLSYSELFAEIQKHPDSTYRLENAEIYYNHQTDSLRFGFWDGSQEYDRANIPMIIVNKKIDFNEVYWEKIPFSALEIKIRKVKFLKEVSFNFNNKESLVHNQRKIRITSHIKQISFYVPSIFVRFPGLEKCEFLKEINISENEEEVASPQENKNIFELNIFLEECRFKRFSFSQKSEQLKKYTLNFLECSADEASIDSRYNLFIANSEIKDLQVKGTNVITIENCVLNSTIEHSNNITIKNCMLNFLTIERSNNEVV
jgi:hypothetical protein